MKNMTIFKKKKYERIVVADLYPFGEHKRREYKKWKGNKLGRRRK